VAEALMNARLAEVSGTDRTGPRGREQSHRLPLRAERADATLARLQLIITRRLDGLLQGDYLGLLPGPGSEAGESREYRPGDDVRRMDWPVTARTTLPHVRHTIADRELETWLAVDLSASLDFGSARYLKRDLAVAAAAAVAHLTVRGGNRIGAVVGTGAEQGKRGTGAEQGHRGTGAEQGRGQGSQRRRGGAGGTSQPGGTGLDGGQRLLRLPARPGRKEAQGLLRAVARTAATAATTAGRTDLGALIDSLNRPPRRRGLAAVISDFLAPPEQWARPLRKLAVRHDLLAIEILDPLELELPNVGVLAVADPESGIVHEIQTSDRRLRERYAAAAAAQRVAVAAAIRAAGASHLRLRTDSDWLLDIVKFVAAARHARTRGTAR
jgi:uncharacterized protein (DUF58 family)